MAKAFWLFAKSTGDGTADDPIRPALPHVGGKWTSPGDVIRLTGPTGNDHRHLLVGGIALADDNLDGQAGDGHVHYVVKAAGQWVQVTVDAPNHTHDLNVDANGNLLPDYFLLFWTGPDADAVTIANDAQCFPIVEANVVEGDEGVSIGALKDGWATEDTAWWHAKILQILGVQLPTEVDRGKRLVRLFLGALLSRQTGDEIGYRFRS
jgi:hypothetical protein